MDGIYRVLEGYDSKLGECDYDQLYYLYFTIPVLRNAHVIAETGMGFGGSTRIFLEALSQLPDPETRTLHTFDIVEPVFSKTPEKIRSLNFKARWELHVNDNTRPFDPGINGIDLLYLDSDHQYKTVANELSCFEKCLKPDTVIWTHDSCPASEHSSFTHGPGNPSDTYYAVKDWGDRHGYRSLLYSHPNGITLLYK